MWRLSDLPGLFLLDSRDTEEIQACLEAPRSKPYRYCLAFHDAISKSEATKLLDSGAEDIVAFPGNTGELLTRLQAGLRRIEFETKLEQQMSSDSASGATTGSGFVRRLEHKNNDNLEHKNNDNTETTNGVVIVLSIDQQDILCTQFGSLVSEMANKTLANCLVEQMTDGDFFGSLEDGVYLVYLEGSKTSEGSQFAELIVNEFKAQQVLAPEFGARITLSGTVLDNVNKTPAQEIVQHALEAFQQVKDSGGNLIVDANDLEQYFSAWQRSNTEANSANETTAKHIMEPLPFVLTANDSHSNHSEPLQFYTLQSKAPKPPCSVVVDREARLLGIVEESYFDRPGTESIQDLEEHITPTSATVDKSLPLSELTDSLATAGSDYLIVLDNEKPIGYITRDKLAATHSISVNQQELAPLFRAEHELEELVVPAS